MIHAELKACMPAISDQLLLVAAPALTAACARAGISTPKRLAACLATCYWESGLTRELVEADGHAYEGRKDLGNVNPGDGHLYRGRGWIHITGRANYAACAAALSLDLVNHPELLEQPGPAADSMAWYWTCFGLNAAADQSFDLVTRRVNGACTEQAPSYQARRRIFYIRNCRILGATP